MTGPVKLELSLERAAELVEAIGGAVAALESVAEDTKLQILKRLIWNHTDPLKALQQELAASHNRVVEAAKLAERMEAEPKRAISVRFEV